MALEVKTTKNSKLPKLSENCFELVGKGGWPLICIWINTIHKFLPDEFLFNIVGEDTTIGLWSKMESLHMTKTLTSKIYLKKKL
jgi:hypothetical protein